MITLTARIELLKSGENNGENGILSGATLSPSILSGNNVSADVAQVIGSKKPITKRFTYGKTILGSGATYTGKQGYFIGNELSDENGNFATPYQIELSGKSIEYVTISFDEVNNNYPKKLIVDGAEVIDDDPNWTIRLDVADKHTITIPDWNIAHSPLIISGIYIDITIDINRRNQSSIEFESIDRADKNLPSYGVISSGGSIEFFDTTGEIADYAKLQILKSGLKASIYLNNTLAKTSQLIAELSTANWDYDSYNKLVKVSLVDDLEEWQEINIGGFYFDFDDVKFKTLKEYYIYLYNQTPQKFAMYSFDELSEQTKLILTNTKIKFPYLENDKLWNQWDKICKLAQLHIYKDKNRTKCTYNEGD